MNVLLTPEALLGIFVLYTNIKKQIEASRGGPVTDEEAIEALRADVARGVAKFDEWLAAHKPETPPAPSE